jgi:hypothetical protein
MHLIENFLELSSIILVIGMLCQSQLHVDERNLGVSFNIS